MHLILFVDYRLGKASRVDSLEPIALLVGGLCAELSTSHQFYLLPFGRNGWRGSHRLIVPVI